MSDVDEFLAHYGIKGMKWGVVKNAASTARDNRAENKAVKRETKAKQYEATAKTIGKEKVAAQKKLDATNKYNVPVKYTRKKKVEELDNQIKTAESDAAAVRAGKMTARQKKLLIGGAVAAGILVAYGTNRSIQSGQFTSMATKGKAAWNGDSKSLFKKNRKFADRNLSADDIVKNVIPGINPGYGDKWGTNMNCRRATFAYEMRRRGYDVQATRTSKGTGQTINGLFKATATEKEEATAGYMSMFGKKTDESYGTGIGKTKIRGGDTEDGIFGALGRQPDRSRGELGVIWKGVMPGIPGGGHSVAYEIIKGKPHIFDTQTGKEYKAGDPIFKEIDSAAFTRLDNVDLNESFLAKWIR